MIGILVPVLGRPQNVQPFLESAQNTENEYCVYFICSPNDRDQIRECQQSEAEVIVASFKPRGADFARKINLAFDLTEEEWLFQAADDVRFSPGWDTKALSMSVIRPAQVVGTNDLGNPLVLRGGHSTHTLFKREYIDDFGSGTVDGSGRVFSELYDHQWCDTEFVYTARYRGRWAFCKQAVVEHFHPHWGKGEMDSTYVKATRATAEDQNLFAARLPMIRRQAQKEKAGRRPLKT